MSLRGLAERMEEDARDERNGAVPLASDPTGRQPIRTQQGETKFGEETEYNASVLACDRKSVCA